MSMNEHGQAWMNMGDKFHWSKCSPGVDLWSSPQLEWSTPMKYPGLGLWKSVRTMDGVSMDVRRLLDINVGMCDDHHSLSLLGHFLWDLDRERVRKGG